MVSLRAAGSLRRLFAVVLAFAVLLAVAALAAPAEARGLPTPRLTLVLEPQSGDNLLGDTHEVTATVTNRRGRGVPNRNVDFTVTSETGTPLAESTTVTPTEGDDITDAAGEATFELSSDAPETVTITACTVSYFRVEICDSATKTFSTTELLDALTVEGGLKHLEAFQAIADANNGTRASATPGYDASGEYVAEQLDAAGYDVETQEFEYRLYSETATAELAQILPNPETYTPFDGTAGDFATFEYEGGGTAEALVTPVDLLLPPTGGSTSGCEAEDFAGFPAGNIALIQRGTCTFGVKVANAEAAGASGVVIFNEGNNAGRTEVISGTLGAETVVTIPAVGVSFATGEEFAALAAGGLTLRNATFSEISLNTTFNVLAETPGGDEDNVVMAGAHLDSVLEGPGINDNGSGSAAILEVALQMADLGIEPNNKVRFAWWGAEESGLVGSNYYVTNVLLDETGELTDEGEAVALYLNFDMVGSPNFKRAIYDGDGSGFGLTGPPGSAAIETAFEEFYAERGLASEPTEFSGRSDYQAFINLAGIPSGGLFTGAEEAKTPAQVALYGGTAGIAFDPNYHQVGDTIDNVNLEVFDQNLDAIGNSVLIYAFSTATVDAQG